MITDLAAFSGMEMENMTRGHGWRFLDIGRRLERAVNGSRLLRTSFSLGHRHQAMLGPLLEISDSVMTYRRRHFSRPPCAQRRAGRSSADSNCPMYRIALLS